MGVNLGTYEYLSIAQNEKEIRFDECHLNKTFTADLIDVYFNFEDGSIRIEGSNWDETEEEYYQVFQTSYNSVKVLEAN